MNTADAISAMFSRLVHDRTLWLPAGLAALAVALVVAFWMVCGQQVRQAESRHAAAKVERVALYDCVRSGGSVATCRSLMAANRTPEGAQQNVLLEGGTLQVSYQR